MQDITFVGLDVHKATIAVSVAAAGRDGEIRHLGRLENRPEVMCLLIERLRGVAASSGVLRGRPRAVTACTGSSPTLAAIMS